ncbi:hypothetical protein NV379_02065 [Paenibacillus sp. N1-5-1-14]|uniref:hypothetical protein n=1 Tax=Paenibacillus radicibacter TaxID=2972488 RepID=UPI002158F07E|nr:hypothetical protein [Paenibacillus radicibacter]MCR8641431.1 hypothetical protein [Paenibacillus radicibacter]
MKREKTIKYIVETTVEVMVSQILEKSIDIRHTICATKEAKAEFGLKAEELISNLASYLPKYEVGMILEALEDCMNNFRKGDRLEITKIEGEKIVLDGVVGTDEETVTQYFKIEGMIC